MKEIRTKIGSLHLYDLLKGAVVAALASPSELLLEILDRGDLPTNINWHGMLKISVATFFAYLIKQFFTGEGGKILSNKKPNKKPNKMPHNYAERINSENDLHVATSMTAKDWAAQNANGIIGDDTTDAPNVNYLNPGVIPPGEDWIDSVTSNQYKGEVVEYIGGRPNDR